MPAVSAKAMAPENVTRVTAFAMLAPPVAAPRAPGGARNTRDPSETAQISMSGGVMKTMTNGKDAPTAN